LEDTGFANMRQGYRARGTAEAVECKRGAPSSNRSTASNSSKNHR
jgi:hypothetical protein